MRLTDRQARMIEISENLHRNELTALERDEQLDEWVKLARDDHSAQSAQNENKRADGRGHRHEGGISAASRDLGIDRDDARRAIKIASLSPEAKDAARETGLDDNRTALETAARQKTPEQQVETLKGIKQAGSVVAFKAAADPVSGVQALEKQVAALMKAWNPASPDAHPASC